MSAISSIEQFFLLHILLVLELYFHIVFTLPHELNSIILQNQEIMYSILLKSAAETLKELALDSKYLGAQIAITEVLHTWGQNLSYHLHVRCLTNETESGFS